jgi:hypothetical protein
MPPKKCNQWDGDPLGDSPSESMPRCCDPFETCPGTSWGMGNWGRLAIKKSSLTEACVEYCGGPGSVSCTSQSTKDHNQYVVRLWNDYDFTTCARPEVNTTPRAKCYTGNEGFTFCNVTGPVYHYEVCKEDGEGGSDCDAQTMPEGSVTCTCN